MDQWDNIKRMKYWPIGIPKLRKKQKRAVKYFKK